MEEGREGGKEWGGRREGEKLRKRKLICSKTRKTDENMPSSSSPHMAHEHLFWVSATPNYSCIHLILSPFNTLNDFLEVSIGAQLTDEKTDLHGGPQLGSGGVMAAC